ncbi:MAG: hypothetical protein N2442_09660 [Spirochaetes bacterium]|nr:hypothetical protein [Spirochaetota bacterium]
MRIHRRMLGVLGCILFVWAGCSGKSSQSSHPSPPPVPASTPEATKEPRVPMVGKKDTVKKPSPPSLTEEKPISLDPLFGVPTQRIYPRDFELGELKPMDPVVQDVLVIAEEFFTRIQQGRSLIELLHPEYRWFLEEELKPWQGKSIPLQDIRVGKVSESSSGVMEIPFRVLHEGNRFTGSMLLEKKETQWYVADFSLDWSVIDSKEKERFDPFKE